MKNQDWAPRRLTSEQAQGYLGCGADLLRRLRLSRKIRAHRLGHRTYSYDRDSLDDYLAQTRIEARRPGGSR